MAITTAAPREGVAAVCFCSHYSMSMCFLILFAKILSTSKIRNQQL